MKTKIPIRSDADMDEMMTRFFVRWAPVGQHPRVTAQLRIDFAEELRELVLAWGAKGAEAALDAFKTEAGKRGAEQ